MSMKDDIYAKLPDTNKFNELSYANLDSVINRMRADDDGLANCIIFDDMGAFLKNADIQKLFKELIMDRRHMHCSIYFLCQTFYSVPREIRKLFSNIFIFKCQKSELDDVMKELFQEAKKDVIDIMNITFTQKFNFLFINPDSGRMFRNFDEIIINKDGDDGGGMNSEDKIYADNKNKI